MTRLRKEPRLLTGVADGGDTWPPRSDELLEKLTLPHTMTLPVMGIQVRFSSNSAAALETVEESFGMWRGTRPSVGRGSEPVLVRLIVFRNEERVRGRAPLTWHVPDVRRMIVQSPGSVGMIDLDRSDVFIYFTPALLADRGHFRYGVLEALTLMAVNGRGRYPVHAAALVRKNTVLLLAGPSGSGKSTLAYAAMSAGFNVLADDAVYLQTQPDFRIWGMPGRLYLRPESRRHFPRRSMLQPTVLANEKTKVVVPVDRDRAAPAQVRVGRVGVVLLERSDGPVLVKRVSPRALQSTLADDLRLPLQRYGSNMRDAIRRLAAPGGWRVTLSSDPADALPLLQDIFDELDRRKAVAGRARSG